MHQVKDSPLDWIATILKTEVNSYYGEEPNWKRETHAEIHADATGSAIYVSMIYVLPCKCYKA